MDIQIEDILDRTHSFSRRLSVSDVYEQLEETENIDKDKEDVFTLLENQCLKSKRLIRISPGEYAIAENLFHGARFPVSLLSWEARENVLLLGHRAIPYYSPALTPADVTLLDEDGKEIPTVEKQISWEILKRFNVGASPRYQVEPVEFDLKERIQSLPEQEQGRRPSLQRSHPGEDLVPSAYHLNLELSEKQLTVPAYDLPWRGTNSFHVIVKSYEEGVLKMRPGEMTEDQAMEHAEKMEEALVSILPDISTRKPYPVLRQTMAKNPELASRVGMHWVHVVLQSDQLRLSGACVQPELRLVQEEERQEETIENLAMEIHYGELLEDYESTPVKLVEDAFEARMEGDDEFPGYMWAIQSKGADCHPPLLEMMKEGGEQKLSFVATALEATWSEDLEDQLKLLVTDERLSDETRNVAMYLLMECGSEDARRFAARAAEDARVEQKEVTTEEALEAYIHTPDELSGLVFSGQPGIEHMIQDLKETTAPELIFIGAPLLYSEQKNHRELGRELLMESRVPSAKKFIQGFKENPVDAIKRMSGTPFPVDSSGMRADPGRVENAFMTPRDGSGDQILGIRAQVGSFHHILLAVMGEKNGMHEAEYAVFEREDLPVEEQVQRIFPGWNMNLYPVPLSYLRPHFLSTEHRDLDQGGILPTDYMLAKILLYLPDEDPNELMSFSAFQEKISSDNISPDDVEKLLGGQITGDAVTWIPLCIFPDHQPSRIADEVDHEGVCDEMMDRISERLEEYAYLLWNDDQQEEARRFLGLFEALNGQNQNIKDRVRSVLLENLRTEKEEGTVPFDLPI